MPKKSANELATPRVVRVEPRLPPPPDLTAAEADLWARVVGAKPSTWYMADSVPVVKAYVRASVQADQLAQRIAEFKPEWLKVEGGSDEFRKLQRDSIDLARLVKTLATSLRLTPQSRYAPSVADTAARTHRLGRRPWDPLPPDEDIAGEA